MSGSNWLSRLQGSVGRSIRRAGTRLLGRSTEAECRYQIAYVVLLNDEVHNYVRRLQVEILEDCGSNPGLSATPHVTLKLGFHAADVEPFGRHLDELAASVPPFEVRLRGFGFFGKDFAYLDVEQDRGLEGLRRRVVQEVAERFDVEPYPLERGDGFHLHATVAYGLPAPQFLRVQRRLETVAVGFTSPALHLALLIRRNGDWITYRRVPPSGPCLSPSARPHPGGR